MLQASNNGWPAHGGSHLIILHHFSVTNVYLPKQMCLQLNKPFSLKLMVLLFSLALPIYKQWVRPIFEYGIVSTITVSESICNKLQRVQISFIRLTLRLPKYVLVHLLHEASGLPYVRGRLITVGHNQLPRMHMNPHVKHTINSAGTNIEWDKYKTPISILKPPD